MKRKIIKQGNSSYTVTLPIGWVEEQQLEDQEVEVTLEDQNLIISAPEGARKKEQVVQVDISGYQARTIKNILNNFYRKGYDKILLTYAGKEQLKEIKKATHGALLGFEVVEESDNECVIQNIAEPASQKYDAILRKVFLSIIEDSLLVFEQIKARKIDMTSFVENKNLFDTYTNFCRRIIIKDKVGGSKDSYFHMVLLSRISIVYHSYFYLADYLASQSKFKLRPATLDALSQTCDAVTLLMEAYYQKDVAKADKIEFLKEKLIYKSIYPLLETGKGIENVVLFRIGESIRFTHLASLNIFSLVDYVKKDSH